jgi:hypothetical protein
MKTEQMKHLAGRPISASTYSNHGCRCDECRADYTADRRPLRQPGARGWYQDKVHRRKQVLAAQWLRCHDPDVWQYITDQAYADVGIERRPIGRPPKQGPA